MSGDATGGCDDPIVARPLPTFEHLDSMVLNRSDALTDPTLPVAVHTALGKLMAKLSQRSTPLLRLDDWFTGEHPTPWVPERARGKFTELLRQSRTNMMELVVSTKEERMVPQGIRWGQEQGLDQEAWRIWQENGLDAEFRRLNTEVLALGGGAMIAWPDPRLPSGVRITCERPQEVIVVMDPSDRRRRLAALKVWHDEWTDRRHATVYTAHALWKFVEDDNGRWAPRKPDEEEWPLRNPWGEVPVVPVPNRPRLHQGDLGTSEFAGVIPNQWMLNKGLFDLAVAAEFAGLPQRWFSGVALEDPESGEAIEPNIRAFADEHFVLSDPQARAGQLPEAQLTNLIKFVELQAQHIATTTKTPPHYMLGQAGVFPSGESLKSTETGLAAAAGRHQVDRNEPVEEINALAMRMRGHTDRSAYDAEVIWQSAEARTLGELIDAGPKLKSIDVPLEGVWEFLGFSPQQIARWRAMATEQERHQARLMADIESMLLDDLPAEDAALAESAGSRRQGAPAPAGV